MTGILLSLTQHLDHYVKLNIGNIINPIPAKSVVLPRVFSAPLLQSSLNVLAKLVLECVQQGRHISMAISILESIKC
jgi:hypothetical protein